MKLTGILIIGYALVNVLAADEPDTATLYPQTKFERCMAAHEGTDAVRDCNKL